MGPSRPPPSPSAASRAPLNPACGSLRVRATPQVERSAIEGAGPASSPAGPQGGRPRPPSWAGTTWTPGRPVTGDGLLAGPEGAVVSVGDGTGTARRRSRAPVPLWGGRGSWEPAPVGEDVGSPGAGPAPRGGVFRDVHPDVRRRDTRRTATRQECARGTGEGRWQIVPSDDDGLVGRPIARAPGAWGDHVSDLGVPPDQCLRSTRTRRAQGVSDGRMRSSVPGRPSPRRRAGAAPRVGVWA